MDMVVERGQSSLDVQRRVVLGAVRRSCRQQLLTVADDNPLHPLHHEHPGDVADVPEGQTAISPDRLAASTTSARTAGSDVTEATGRDSDFDSVVVSPSDDSEGCPVGRSANASKT